MESNNRISTRTPEFKRTPAATIKANRNTARSAAGNKKIVDFSYLCDCLNSIDWNQFNNLQISAAGIAEIIAGKIAAIDPEYDTMPVIKVTTFDYVFYIHLQPQRYIITDQDDYKILYNYYYHDNMKIVMYSRFSDMPVFSAEFNPHKCQAFRSSIRTTHN